MCTDAGQAEVGGGHAGEALNGAGQAQAGRLVLARGTQALPIGQNLVVEAGSAVGGGSDAGEAGGVTEQTDLQGLVVAISAGAQKTGGVLVSVSAADCAVILATPDARQAGVMAGLADRSERGGDVEVASQALAVATN